MVALTSVCERLAGSLGDARHTQSGMNQGPKRYQSGKTEAFFRPGQARNPPNGRGENLVPSPPRCLSFFVGIHRCRYNCRD